MYERTHDGVARVILQHVDSEKKPKIGWFKNNCAEGLQCARYARHRDRLESDTPILADACLPIVPMLFIDCTNARFVNSQIQPVPQHILNRPTHPAERQLHQVHSLV